jgi:hypothetical protein
VGSRGGCALRGGRPKRFGPSDMHLGLARPAACPTTACNTCLTPVVQPRVSRTNAAMCCSRCSVLLPRPGRVCRCWDRRLPRYALMGAGGPRRWVGSRVGCALRHATHRWCLLTGVRLVWHTSVDQCGRLSSATPTNNAPREGSCPAVPVCTTSMPSSTCVVQWS